MAYKEADPQLNEAATKPKTAPAKADPAGKPSGAADAGSAAAEPKLSPEAEAARVGGMMARLPAAPPGVLAEKPDPRASYQTSDKDMSSPLINITQLASAAGAAPKPTSSGIDTGGKAAEPKAKDEAAPAADASKTEDPNADEAA
jgi:hypothetical protein